MAIGIGGVSCSLLKGDVRDLKERVDVWQQPGIDGYGAQLLGLGDSGFQFQCVLFDSLASIQLWARDLEALQGTIVSCENDSGIVFTNLLVLNVSDPETSPFFSPSERHRSEVKVSGLVVGAIS